MPKHQEVTPTTPTPFTVFDAATGDILRSGTCQRQSLALQSTAPSEIVIEGRYDDGEYIIHMAPEGPRPRKRRAQGATAEDVRAETQDRILARYSITDQLNAEDGEERDQMRAWINDVRAAGRRLAGMRTIPANYRDARYWPD